MLLEAEVTLTPVRGDKVQFGEGDLVVFASGMKCQWDVHKAFRKHFHFKD